MAASKLKGFIGVCLFVVLVMGCTSHFISSETRERAQENVTLRMVLADPDAYIGTTVIWGGAILEAVDRRDGTEIEVIEKPLDDRGRPMVMEDSRGQFLVKSSKRLDSNVFKKGRLVVVAGEIIENESGQSGRRQITYPVLNIEELQVCGDQLYETVGAYRKVGPVGRSVGTVTR